MKSIKIFRSSAGAAVAAAAAAAAAVVTVAVNLFLYTKTKETGELSHENLIPSHVKITCFPHLDRKSVV